MSRELMRAIYLHFSYDSKCLEKKAKWQRIKCVAREYISFHALFIIAHHLNKDKWYFMRIARESESTREHEKLIEDCSFSIETFGLQLKISWLFPWKKLSQNKFFYSLFPNSDRSR